MTMHFWIFSSLFFTILIAGVVGAPYYGKLVGALSENAHMVSGTVYLVDEKTIRIRNFNYDGTGPAGVVWVGFEGMENIENSPTSAGMAIPDPDGNSEEIRRYNNEDIQIILPADKTVQTLLWLSIWCIDFAANFGSVEFSSAIRNDPPWKVNLGPFNGRAHQVSSGDVILINSRTIMIKDLVYDGTGPGAWFVVGPGSSYRYENETATPIVPNEDGSTAVLGGYSEETITIMLPDEYDIRGNGFRWLNIFCIDVGVNFGEVLIPANVNVIPYTGMDSSLSNCEEMNNDFQVAWQIVGDDIQFEFLGRIDDDEYMAFGLSGSTSATNMDNADVVVAHYSENQAMADDYDLNQRSQCSGGVGACPDDRVTGAVNSVSDVTGSKVNGITRVKFTRKLNTGDTTGDKVYSTSGEQYIVWAMGKLNPDLIATKHDTIINPAENKRLNFGRSADNNCSPLQGTTDPGTEVDPWSITPICDETEFDVTIGPSGGDQGYSAITKTNAWGIALYIDGLLIPEVHVQKNKTYTFRIRSGDNENNQAEYHPFYITSDPQGGHKQRTAGERAGITIFAGLDENGDPLPNSVGPLCEYQKNPAVSENDFETFGAFKNSLTQHPADCAQSNNYGELVWTVPADSPSVVYYHCWTHNWLGWKIIVHENDDPACSSSFVLPSMITLITAVCLSISFK